MTRKQQEKEAKARQKEEQRQRLEKAREFKLHQVVVSEEFMVS